MGRAGLTAEQFAQVLARVEAGDPISTACEVVGVSRPAVDGRRRRLGLEWPKTSLEASRRFADTPLNQLHHDYTATLDAHLCDPTDSDKLRAWRHAARNLLGEKAATIYSDPPPQGPRAIAD